MCLPNHVLKRRCALLDETIEEDIIKARKEMEEELAKKPNPYMEVIEMANDELDVVETMTTGVFTPREKFKKEFIKDMKAFGAYLDSQNEPKTAREIVKEHLEELKRTNNFS